MGGRITMTNKAALHKDITEELNKIYIAKNADYGDAFGETYRKLGIISAVTRITDKVNRLQSLATKSEEERMVKDESIVDSAKDLANYAIMLLIEMGYEPEVVEDSHSINAGGSSFNEMDIDLNEAMRAFANIGGQ